MKDDVIIVGAGIGGLCCGALLAHGGHKVTIFEKNPYLGGACSSYTKEGYTFDRGVHIFTSGLNGPYGQVMSRIGLDTLKFQEHINEKTGIKFYKKDNIYPFNLNVNSAMKMLKPSSEKKEGSGGGGGGNFMKGFLGMGLEKQDMKNFMRVFTALMTMSKRKIKLLFENDMTVTQWVNQYSEHPVIHGIFGFMLAAMFCISPKKASAAEFIYCFKNEMLAPEGMHYPSKGGAQAIPDAFADAIKKFGGEIHINSRVSSIAIKGNKVQGVMIKDKLIEAPIVISNLDIRMTTTALVGRDYYEKSYLSKVEKLEPSFSAITFKLALNEPIIKDWSYVNCYHSSMLDFAEKYPPDKGYPYSNGFFVPILSNLDPSLAPPGAQSIIFGVTVPTKGPDWEKWKEVYWEDINTFFPGLEKKVKFSEISLPKDLVELTGKPAGPVEGLALTTEQCGKNKPSSVGPNIEGLFVVGDTAGKTAHGIGTQLAADSGIQCADVILGLREIDTI
jgi:phytoene dehydrogenase-like protein